VTQRGYHRADDRLSELARQRGQSLQAYLFDVISDEARPPGQCAVNLIR
jgi:hypothetical protein